MSFKFGGYEIVGNFNSTVLPHAGRSKADDIVSSYFIDTAGIMMESYCEYLKTCLTKLEDKSIYEDDISSEHYDVKIVGDRVKFEFEFDYDEDDRCEVDRAKLAQILSLWIAFLEKEPVEGYEEYHEITL